MNLVADLGNTRLKAALFNGSELLSFKLFRTTEDFLDDIDFYGSAKNAIIGSVTDQHTKIQNAFEKKIRTILFTQNTPIPIKNLYKSASTLGSDRLAASIGAHTFFPSRNVLTIDAGTCIKYNFVNDHNEYLGGGISPGLSMRLKAMNHFTARLPYVPPDFNYEKLTGNSTDESLLSGAMIGAAAEAENMIDRYLEKYDQLQVVITGGDSDYLCKQLKNRFFAHPYLVLIGLNSILNYNLEK